MKPHVWSLSTYGSNTWSSKSSGVNSLFYWKLSWRWSVLLLFFQFCLHVDFVPKSWVPTSCKCRGRSPKESLKATGCFTAPSQVRSRFRSQQRCCWFHLCKNLLVLTPPQKSTQITNVCTDVHVARDTRVGRKHQCAALALLCRRADSCCS